MQAELNKYFYNDISNIISDYHYKTQFYEVMKEMTDFIKENTWLLDDDDNEDSEDDDDNEDSEDNHDQSYEISCFRIECLINYRSRIRKIKRQNTMNEEDTDSDIEDRDPYKIFRTKDYHYYKKSYYSPEEFAYKIRYPDADEDCDF
jgi:hypothetical protein